MTAFCHRAAAVCLALLIHQQGVADGLPVDAGQLIADLASNDFAVRQQATSQLRQAGQEALPYVLRGLQSADAEIRNRCWNILLEQAVSSRADVRAIARDAIKQLGNQNGREDSASIQGGLTRIRDAIASQASAELSSLGAMTMPVQGGPPATFN